MAKKTTQKDLDWQAYIDADEQTVAKLPRGDKIRMGREATAWCMKLVDHFLLGRPRGVAGAFLARHLSSRQIDKLQRVAENANEQLQAVAQRAEAKKKKAEVRALIKQLQEKGMDTSALEKQLEQL